MRKRVPTLVITFASTAKAMQMENCCKNVDAPGRLIPLPGEISAGCGLAWSLKPEFKDEIIEIMRANNIQEEGMYEILF